MRDKLMAAMAGAVGALVAVAVMGAAGGRQTFGAIRAEQIELVDKAGKVRGMWFVDSEGTKLVLCDVAGKARVALTVGKGSAGVSMWDAGGDLCLGMSDNPLMNGPAVVLLDKAGNVAWRTP